MADEYGFATTEEEFTALLDQLVDKVLDKQTQQTSARQALSEIIGIDLDKVEKLINGGQIIFSDEENEQTEQEEPESVFAEDLFTATVELVNNYIDRYNRLHKAGCRTVSDVADFEIMRIRAGHEYSLDEI